jgi:hypothetical protein
MIEDPPPPKTPDPLDAISIFPLALWESAGVRVWKQPRNLGIGI